MSPSTPSSWRPVVVTLALLVGVVALRSTVVPGGAHFAFHCAFIVVLLAAARAFGLRADDLGLDRASLRHGARAALVVFLAVGAVVGVVVWVASGSSSLDDGRVDMDAAGMWWKALVVIPIGTVLMEELAFRGVLLANTRRVTSTRNAIALSSIAFGVWHVLTAWNTATGDAPARLLPVVGTVLATGALGVALCWLRLRYRSLLPAIAAHWAVNSVSFAVAWFAAR